MPRRDCSARGLSGPRRPWGSFLGDLSQAPRVPGSTALPLPVWALRRRPLWNVCLVAEGQAGLASTSRLGSMEGSLGLPHACSPAPGFILCFPPLAR